MQIWPPDVPGGFESLVPGSVSITFPISECAYLPSTLQIISMQNC